MGCKEIEASLRKAHKNWSEEKVKSTAQMILKKQGKSMKSMPCFEYKYNQTGDIIVSGIFAEGSPDQRINLKTKESEPDVLLDPCLDSLTYQAKTRNGDIEHMQYDRKANPDGRSMAAFDVLETKRVKTEEINGAWAETIMRKTYPHFDEVKSKLETGELCGFSFAFDTIPDETTILEGKRYLGNAFLHNLTWTGDPMQEKSQFAEVQFKSNKFTKMADEKKKPEEEKKPFSVSEEEFKAVTDRITALETEVKEVKEKPEPEVKSIKETPEYKAIEDKITEDSIEVKKRLDALQKEVDTGVKLKAIMEKIDSDPMPDTKTKTEDIKIVKS